MQFGRSCISSSSIFHSAEVCSNTLVHLHVYEEQGSLLTYFSEQHVQLLLLFSSSAHKGICEVDWHPRDLIDCRTRFATVILDALDTSDSDKTGNNCRERAWDFHCVLPFGLQSLASIYIFIFSFLAVCGNMQESKSLWLCQISWHTTHSFSEIQFLTIALHDSKPSCY